MICVRPATLALLLTALAAAAPLRAEELRFGVTSEVSWDNNVFSTSSDSEIDQVDDWSLRVTPSMEVEDRDGSLQWEFGYRPAWEGFLDTENVDGWDHSVHGRVTVRLAPTTWVEVSDTFDRFQSISRFNETIEDDFGQVITETLARTNRFKRNELQARITHQLSVDQQLAMVFQHFLLDFPENPDRSTLGLLLSYRKQMTERLATGLTGGWRRQTFEGVAGTDDRKTDFYNVSGLVEYRFDPTFEISASAGPSLVDAEATQGFATVLPGQARFPTVPTASGPRFVMASSCPTTDAGSFFVSDDCDLLPFSLPAGVAGVRDLPFSGEDASDQDARLTFFADVSLRKRWEQWSLVLAYRRQDDTSASFGTSTISDVVNLNLTWDPSPRWRFGLGGAWVRQEQSTDGVQPVILVRPLSMAEQIPLGGISVVIPAGTGEAFAVGTVQAENDFEQTNIVISARASYRLTRRIRIFARAYYTDVSRDGLLTRAGDYDRFAASLGVNYEFEPIRF